MGAKFWLMASGAALILIGVLIRWKTARYDLKDAAIDSAWTLARGRRTAENPTALEAKFNEIRVAADVDRQGHQRSGHGRRPFRRPGAGRGGAGPGAGRTGAGDFRVLLGLSTAP